MARTAARGLILRVQTLILTAANYWGREMRLVFIAAAASALFFMLAPSSGANVPKGKGLDLVPASPFGLFCADSTEPYSVLLTPGGSAGTAWRVEAQDHYVLSRFAITTSINGTVVFSDSKSWGVKAGHGSLECSSFFSDGTQTTVINATIHPLP
jgi:hypothetical protein